MEDKEYFKNQGWALFTLFIVGVLSAIIFLSMMWGISIGHFLRELWNTAVAPFRAAYANS
jgi:hypothetical protein